MFPSQTLRLTTPLFEQWQGRFTRWQGAMAVGGAILGAGLFVVTQPSDAETPPTRPATMAIPAEPASTTVEKHGLRRLAMDLETEVDRLEAAAADLDARSSALLGPATEGRRSLKIPQDQEALIRYLKQCLALVEEVEHSFGELVVGEDQVDLKARIPEAHKNVARLEKLGSAGLLVRRQVKAWIEKDLQAVDALTDEWPEIQESARRLAGKAKEFESGDVTFEDFSTHHLAVLKCAESRTHFAESRLGRLCRQSADVASRLHRERQEQARVAAR
ncbi:MAG TPA: hypothetical protein VM452_20175 [Caulifigura sp.]|jgi:hypothetical protein|nr:hypothetical protein [Caulifigura sp.]